jgi:hypothetical protein
VNNVKPVTESCETDSFPNALYQYTSNVADLLKKDEEFVNPGKNRICSRGYQTPIASRLTTVINSGCLQNYSGSERIFNE